MFIYLFQYLLYILYACFHFSYTYQHVIYVYIYIKFFSNYMQSTKSVKYRNSLKILARAETVVQRSGILIGSLWRTSGFLLRSLNDQTRAIYIRNFLFTTISLNVKHDSKNSIKGTFELVSDQACRCHTLIKLTAKVNPFTGTVYEKLTVKEEGPRQRHWQ